MAPWARQFIGLYASIGSRVGLGFAMIGSIVSTIPVEGELVFDFGKFLTISLAIAAWIGAEISSYRSKPHPHDIELRRKIREMTEPTLDFLNNHDLGAPFRIDNIQPLREIATNWKGVRFQFQDTTLQHEWKKAFDLIERFNAHVAWNSDFLGANHSFLTFKTASDKVRGISKKTTENMRIANETATEIYNALESLELLCLRRLDNP